MWFNGKIVMIDEHGDKTSLVYDLGATGTPADALTKLNNIAEAMADVSSANIFDVVLTVHDDTNIVGTLPAEAEITEECVLSVHLLAEPLQPKYGVLRIPAPVNGVFLGDKTTVDTGDADLLAYVAAVAANALVSDGENIITARGFGGIAKGHRRSKARSFA